MNNAVLGRFVKYMFVLVLVMSTGYMLYNSFGKREPGDYYTELGSNRLQDGQHKEALKNFEKALKEKPDHYGAMMGRAITYLQMKNYDRATREFTALIERLHKLDLKKDSRARGSLAAAYANRGIIHDRHGRYEKALKDYVMAIRVDADAVSGPDLFQRVAHGRQSTIRKRAIYLAKQLKLPPEKRLLRVPELDKKQRMYKP